MRISDGSSDVCSSDLRDPEGKLYNIVALLDRGQVVAVRRKHELPNYGTFDEKRVFAPGPLPDIVEWRGVKLGLPICEDGRLEARRVGQECVSTCSSRRSPVP